MSDIQEHSEGRLSLGEELRSRREALGMAVEDLARAAHVSAESVVALEEGDYHHFPAKVYAQGAVRCIAHIFGNRDSEMLAGLLNREWPDAKTRVSPASSGEIRRPFAGLFLTPRKTGIFAVSLFSFFILGFWGLRLFIFTAPPLLIVESPVSHSRITSPTAVVAGTTEKESHLTVNGREIRIDERGAFREDIELPIGTNRLEFVTESRFGKTSRDVRHILVE
ncbi:MAG: XRE family transcriptional regulator [Parcubacteria group bacterium Greene0714_36]|nr:MAG: XRE family transcriptional regulator [Parcubacteria group bacterium Greene0714_36]